MPSTHLPAIPPALLLCAASVLRPVFRELCFNLESFNPAFTSCLLMVGLGVCMYRGVFMPLCACVCMCIHAWLHERVRVCV